MKPLKINKKLTLNKTTITRLNEQTLNEIRGGYTLLETNCPETCGITYPLISCMYTCNMETCATCPTCNGYTCDLPCLPW